MKAFVEFGHKVNDQYFTLYLINTFSPLRNFH